MPTICFLPWLHLGREDEVVVGGTRFVRYRRGSDPFGEGSPQQRVADTVFVPFRDHGVTQLAQATIAGRRGKDLLDDLTYEEKRLVGMDTEILCLAAIACNKYFNPMGSYANYSAFEVLFKQTTGDLGAIKLTLRRRDGPEVLMSGAERVALGRAPGSSSTRFMKFDRDLIRGVAAKRDRSSGWQRWEDAIRCFNLANTDSYLVTEEVELVLMVSACQQLLDVGKRKGQEVAEAFAHAPQPGLAPGRVEPRQEAGSGQEEGTESAHEMDEGLLQGPQRPCPRAIAVRKGCPLAPSLRVPAARGIRVPTRRQAAPGGRGLVHAQCGRPRPCQRFRAPRRRRLAHPGRYRIRGLPMPVEPDHVCCVQ